MIISKDFTFEASHILPKHPGKCSRLHGHSWKLTVTVEGDIDPSTGFVCDYSQLKKLVDYNCIDYLDHTHLGQGYARAGHVDFKPPFGDDFYPSSENLCRAIYKLLSPLVKELAHGIELYSITIKETCTSAASWCCFDEAGFIRATGPDGSLAQFAAEFPIRPGEVGVHKEPGSGNEASD